MDSVADLSGSVFRRRRAGATLEMDRAWVGVFVAFRATGHFCLGLFLVRNDRRNADGGTDSVSSFVWILRRFRRRPGHQLLDVASCAGANILGTADPRDPCWLWVRPGLSQSVSHRTSLGFE